MIYGLQCDLPILSAQPPHKHQPEYHLFLGKIMNKTGCSSTLHRSIMFLQFHHVVWTSQILFLGKVQFFFSGLTAGPTYQPLVQDSNPDTPLQTWLAGKKNKIVINKADF